jgi:hypothetical protein
MGAQQHSCISAAQDSAAAENMLKDVSFCLRVQATQNIIENVHTSIVGVEGSGDGQSLFLSSAQCDGTTSDTGLIAIGQGLQVTIKHGRPQHQIVSIMLIVVEPDDVPSNRFVCKEWLLATVADLSLASESDRPAREWQFAKEGFAECRLAAGNRANHQSERRFRDGEVDILQNRTVIPSKGHVDHRDL